MEFYDAAGVLLLTVSAPRAVDANGQSFAGALFDTGIVARVRIICGDAPLSATLAETNVLVTGPDLVVMDDFIYGEPTAAP